MPTCPPALLPSCPHPQIQLVGPLSPMLTASSSVCGIVMLRSVSAELRPQVLVVCGLQQRTDSCHGVDVDKLLSHQCYVTGIF